MALEGNQTFVGFGFGPIQTGLFLYEAYHSGNFRRLVIAEVLPEVVAAVRGNHGRFSLNVAHARGVESSTLGPIEMYDPAVEDDRKQLVAAIREAAEVATAVPSADSYRAAGPGSLHELLARGLEERQGKPALIYAAENHNRAAEILREAVLEECDAKTRGVRSSLREKGRFVNTVIGKMSGVVSDDVQIESRGIVRLTPSAERAHLVESFNRILIESPMADGGTECDRGISVFEEKSDLLPFEEAKLYGHNAAHALAAYLAALCGLSRMNDLAKRRDILDFVRQAFLEESGNALIHRYAGQDPLFTREGYASYTDDLVERMINPHLGDLVSRVTRDPERKLGWNDRLVGTMRLAVAAGVRPQRFAVGVAAALIHLRPQIVDGRSEARGVLSPIWKRENPAPAEAEEILALIEEGMSRLRNEGWPEREKG